MRLIDADAIRVKPEYMENICGIAMIRAEDLARILIEQPTIPYELKEQDEEHRRLLSWLGKFCRHIDNGDAWLTDEENIAFFKEKMKQQFGWDTD